MSNKCVCCGAFLEAGVAKCKYCGASVPVAQRSESQGESFNQNATPQNQAPNQNFDQLGALFMSGAMVAEAARSAAESARIAAEAARAAAEAASRSQDSTIGFSPVTSSATSSGKNCGRNIFASSNWKEIWREKGLENRYLGIILTNTKGLKDADAFTAALNSYLDYKTQNGVDYYVLDLNNQAIESVDGKDVEDILLNILFPVYLVTVPHYLLIIGDTTVVPNARWANYADPYDEDVASDLVYLTFDTESPWDGVEYNFENITQVGRIPAKTSNGFSEAIAYFDRVKKFRPYSGIKAFACSALVWEATSVVEFAHLNPTLITSPKYTSNPATAAANNLTLLHKLSPEYNVIATNLHGSDEEHEWFGQEGRFLPEAFCKAVLPENNGYILCTEACYGARPQATESMVVYSLMNGCMAFVGSSRIAFGMDDGTVYCADVIAQVFTYAMACGFTSGLSFLAALTALSQREMDEAEIKTLAEFALYGDPSFELVANTAHSKQKKQGKPSAVKMSKTRKDKSKAILLAACTENNNRLAKGSKNFMLFKQCSNTERAKMKLMADKVCKTSDRYVMEKFSTMKNVKPSVFKVVGKEEYRAVYAQVQGGIKTIVTMHLDGEGNMKKVYHSK